LLHLVVDYDDTAHPASLSFQHKDRLIQRSLQLRSVDASRALIAFSAGGLSGPDFCLIFAPCGYDDPEILPS
jgi:hypothetical protein